MPQGTSNILYDAVALGIRRGERVSSYHIEGEWFEVGNEADFLYTTQRLISYRQVHSQGMQLAKFLNYFGYSAPKIEEELFSSSANISPQTTISSATLLAKNIKIEREAQLAGYNVIGYGVHIGVGAQLLNTVVLPYVKVPDYAKIASRIVFE